MPTLYPSMHDMKLLQYLRRSDRIDSTLFKYNNLKFNPFSKHILHNAHPVSNKNELRC